MILNLAYFELFKDTFDNVQILLLTFAYFINYILPIIVLACFEKISLSQWKFLLKLHILKNLSSDDSYLTKISADVNGGKERWLRFLEPLYAFSVTRFGTVACFQCDQIWNKFPTWEF